MTAHVFKFGSDGEKAAHSSGFGSDGEKAAHSSGFGSEGEKAAFGSAFNPGAGTTARAFAPFADRKTAAVSMNKTAFDPSVRDRRRVSLGKGMTFR